MIRINLGSKGNPSERIGEKAQSGNLLYVLLMGLAFALAFCLYSGVALFGMLIPITISSVKGHYLPITYALGTGLAVIIFAYFIAFTVGTIGKTYNKVKTYELWLRRVVAVVFKGVGIYYLNIFLF